MNVLVIDPDVQTAAQVRRVLGERSEVAVEAAQSGTDAWMILGNFRHRFDAVILELSLPDIDGLQLIERMRRSPKHAGVAVIVCCSRLHRDTAAKVISLGVKHFIVKPAADDIVLGKLSQVMAADSEASTAKTPVAATAVAAA